MRVDSPQVSFADLELKWQGVHLDPLLEQISGFIEEHPELVEAVRCDLERDLKNPQTGRNGLTPNQALRSLVLMRVKNWDYRELRERINDGYTLRNFTGFYSRRVPKHNAFNQAFNRLRPATIEAINDAVIRAAVADGLEDGSKLRVDTTVVETDIRWPTDATLLWDTVRVLTRLIGCLRRIVPNDVPRFRKRNRAARKRMQKLQRMSASQRKTQQVPVYRELLGITRQVLNHARGAVDATAQSCGATATDALTIATLRVEIIHYADLGDRVMDQTHRRVIEGEQVPASEKIYSIFEAHTDLIKRGKINKPTEFGHKVFLAESAQGLITQYRVLDGNPPDDGHVTGSLQNHQDAFGRPPDVFAGDRGFYSPGNHEACLAAGVACISIPQCGGQKTVERESFEKTAAFKQGQRFRAGIEGRISVLCRGRGMRRCRAHGRERFECFVGAVVITNNLMKIAELRIKKKKQRKPRLRAA